MTTPTNRDLVAAAKRELALRKRVYPGFVAQGRMHQSKADHEIVCMAEILRILERNQTLNEVCDEWKLPLPANVK